MKISWDTYFLNIAAEAAKRATCDRAQVGCVLAKNNRVLSIGYNGSVSKTDECDIVGHLMDNNHCIRTIHAEANAIISAARHGVAIEGAACYCTLEPCFNCLKMLLNSGITRIIFFKYYCEEPFKLHSLALGLKNMVYTSDENSAILLQDLWYHGIIIDYECKNRKKAAGKV